MRAWASEIKKLVAMTAMYNLQKRREAKRGDFSPRPAASAGVRLLIFAHFFATSSKHAVL